MYIYDRKLTLEKTDNEHSKVVNELKSIDKTRMCKMS